MFLPVRSDPAMPVLDMSLDVMPTQPLQETVGSLCGGAAAIVIDGVRLRTEEPAARTRPSPGW